MIPLLLLVTGRQCYVDDVLQQDDVISVADLDKVMSDGLGMRYAFMGPFETCHLNAEGMVFIDSVHVVTV